MGSNVVAVVSCCILAQMLPAVALHATHQDTPKFQDELNDIAKAALVANGPATFQDIIDSYKQQMCSDSQPGCNQTKVLMTKITDRAKNLIQNDQSLDWVQDHEQLLLEEIRGWNHFLQDVESEYTSVADMFLHAQGFAKDLPAADDTHIDYATARSYFHMSEYAVRLAETDGVQGLLTYGEVQDYVHMVVELLDQLKIGDPTFFQLMHSSGWDCLNGKENSPPSCTDIQRQ